MVAGTSKALLQLCTFPGLPRMLIGLQALQDAQSEMRRETAHMSQLPATGRTV
jgi:hypothetical protein